MNQRQRDPIYSTQVTKPHSTPLLPSIEDEPLTYTPLFPYIRGLRPGRRTP